MKKKHIIIILASLITVMTGCSKTTENIKPQEIISTKESIKFEENIKTEEYVQSEINTLMQDNVQTEVMTKEDTTQVLENVLGNISAEENIIEKLGLGINLGNTMEAVSGNTTVESFETSWGSPIITKEIIDGYKNSGFGVVRVPVAWSNLMGEDYTISKELMQRVKQITQWIIDDDMYAIVNIHWDGGWFENFPDNKNECMYKYIRIWQQISEEFKDYDEHLILESLNEEGCFDRLWNHYGGDTYRKKEAYDLLNEINENFVNVVRNSAGYNKNRYLLIAGYATDIDLTCDEYFVMPSDPVNKSMVSIHYYTPTTYTIIDHDESWGRALTDWGTQDDYNQLENQFLKLKEHFVDKGIPVIMGEYGVVAMSNKDRDNINNYVENVCRAAVMNGICPVLWDYTGLYYDRNSCRIKDEELMERLKALK